MNLHRQTGAAKNSTAVTAHFNRLNSSILLLKGGMMDGGEGEEVEGPLGPEGLAWWVRESGVCCQCWPMLDDGEEKGQLPASMSRVQSFELLLL